METKKNPKANLENYRASFLLLGLVMVLVLLFGIFQFSRPNTKLADLYGSNNTYVDIDMMKVTRQDIPKPPPPVKTSFSDKIDVVDNDIKILEKYTVPDTDFDGCFPDTLFSSETQKIFNPVIFAPQMPVYPGGYKALKLYISENTVYPDLAIENKIEGTVYLRFVVDTDGSVSNIQVLKKVDPLLEAEAVRVLKSLRKFKPGMDKDGNKVAVWMNIPFEFKLQK